jgi:hypothetical protein
MSSVRATATLVVLLVSSCLAQKPGIEPQVITQIPLRASGSRVTLDVTVNGQGPFVFGLDTGASGAAWVTRALVEKLNLPVVDGTVISDGSGSKGRPADGARIRSISLGTVSFNELTAIVLGEGPAPGREGDVYGTLGFELFKDYVVTLDYPGQQLRIATGELPVADGKRVLNYRLEQGAAYIPVDIGGVVLEASIDSGNMGGVLLPLSLSSKVPLRAPLQQAGKVASALNEFDLYRGELDGDLRIGEIAISGPTVFFSDFVQAPNVGRGVIRSFAVTFDQPHRRVQFTRPRTEK